MEEQPFLPFIIQIHCSPPSGRTYYATYLGIESLKMRGIPVAWRKKYWSAPRSYCYELELYQVKKHVATLFFDLGSATPSEERLIGVEFIKDEVFSDESDEKNTFMDLFRNRNIYLSRKELTVERKKIPEDKQLLVKEINKFIEEFIQLSLPPILAETSDENALDESDIDELTSSSNEVDEKNKVERILNEYVALNNLKNTHEFPHVFDQLIAVEESVWRIHNAQLKKLTKLDCICPIKSSTQDFRHPDLDLALKIASNPELAKVCQELDQCNSIGNKIAKLNEICRDGAKRNINLTGMNFSAIIGENSEGNSEGIAFNPSEFGIEFDYAIFDGVVLAAQASWSSVSLNYASFVGSQLPFVNFYGAELKGADFRKANLTGANLTMANIAGADFTGAILDQIKWPLIQGGYLSVLPKLDWNQYGAEFILQQLDQIKELDISVENKQTRAKELFDTVLSNITTSEELVKFVALIDGKTDRFAWLREETSWYRGAFFGWHGNTDAWHDIIGSLKVHLDVLLVKEAKKGHIDDTYRKIWESAEQYEAFNKIMSEHRGRGFGEVTHTKLYSGFLGWGSGATELVSSKDAEELRNSYMDQDMNFKRKFKDIDKSQTSLKR